MRNKVGKQGKQNRYAGKHPSYKKRNMSKESIEKKKAYDSKYQKSRVGYRQELNKERRKLIKKGKLKRGDGKDISHKKAYKSGGKLKSGYRIESKSKNRARK